MDLEKAYEMASKTAILYLLAKKGFGGSILGWLESFLTNRSAHVKFQGAKSRELEFENGTPQGSALSPFLFNVLMDQVISIKVPKGVTILSYADDLCIVIKGKGCIAVAWKTIAIFERECESLGLKISIPKTNAIFFGKTNPEQELRIYDQPISWINKAKYLGCIFDKRLSFSAHITYVIDKANRRINLMRAMWGSDLGLTTDMLLQYYKVAIRPILEYAAPVVIFASKNQKLRLQRVQNIALRIAHGAPKCTNIISLHLEGKTETMDTRLQKLAVKFVLKKIRDTTHPLSKKLLTCIVQSREVFKKRTWEYVVTSTLIENDIVPVTEVGFKEIAPWSRHKLVTTVNRLHGPKSTYDKKALRDHALSNIQILSEGCQGIYYTDGSIMEDGKAGSAAIIDNVQICARISDGSSSMQAELIAIYLAVLHAQAHKINDVLINTDSLGAIQRLSSHNDKDNLSIVNAIHKVIDKNLMPNIVNINWVPSHVLIPGNEKADEVAKLAANAPKVHLEILKTTSQLFKTAAKRIKHTYNIMVVELAESNSRFQWYFETTLDCPNRIPKGIPSYIAKQIRFLYFNHPTRKAIMEKEFECELCQGTFSITHYLAVCPALYRYHQQLLQILPIDQHETDPEYLTKNILLYIRKSGSYDVIVNMVQMFPPLLHAQRQ